MKKYAYIGALGFLAIITTEFGIIGILPQVAKYYQISIDQAGYLLSGFALIIALTGPLMTLLTAGIDRKKLLLTALFIFLITTIASSFSPPFWLLLLLRMLPAFLQPVYIATALSIAVSQGNKQNENELMSIVFSGVTIGMVTTIPFATYIASLYSWQYSFIIQAAISLIAILAIQFFLPTMPIKLKNSYGSQLKILKKPIFLVSALMNFFMITAWFSTYSYFAEYLNKAKSMDQTRISTMLLVFGLIGVFSNWIAGKMLNKSITRTTAIFLFGTLIIPVLLHYSGGDNTATLFVIALWGFLYSPSFLNASTYMISSAPEAMEFANSLSTSFGNFGVTIGTTVGGWVIISNGVEYTPWLTMLFGSLAFLMILIRKYIEQKNKVHKK